MADKRKKQTTMRVFEKDLRLINIIGGMGEMNQAEVVAFLLRSTIGVDVENYEGDVVELAKRVTTKLAELDESTEENCRVAA